jgi:AraC-like DNA-binding protein
VIPAICLLGFLGSILLLNFADKVNPANRYLAYHFFLNSLFGIAHWASVISDSETLRAIFTIHYFPVYLLNTPFLYFYVRAVLTNKVQIRGWDYIHFLPFFIVLMNVLPYGIQSWAYKLNFAHQLHLDSKAIYLVYFPLISFPVYFVSRSIFSLIYIFSAYQIVLKAIKLGLLAKNIVLKRWLITCLALGGIFNFSLLVFSFYSLWQNHFLLLMNEHGMGRTVATVVMTVQIVTIYFFPRILYGLQFSSGTSISDVIKLNEEIATIAKTPELSNERLKQVDKLIQTYVNEQKFLVPGYSMSDLVKDLSTPEHVLTYYFNNYKGITFLKWKNQLRIEEAIKLLNAGEANTHTLESVGKACGYKSRSNFIQAFKTQTGQSPSAFLKKLS